MLLFRALAKNMAPITNADESPTNRLKLFPMYLVSLCSINSVDITVMTACAAAYWATVIDICMAYGKTWTGLD